ncbi:HAMP domain-containing sensor histidine kinase [Porifericola rhodea]|uniref:sensor histidine kinase n=1 Tax=Porifericola rhodea TaxID=930972 RepID=UPI0026652AB6|nr:HAMP domain-containing sensor histidine kinase [Porifericola rhodea]WKN29795.1 HAMP domain-containing sensor histidine kinase [Porifericola rhodea]
MSRSPSSDIDRKQQLDKLLNEKQQLEDAIARLKKEKFALAEKLHLQEEVLNANHTGLFEWKIGTKEFYLRFPWQKVVGESVAVEKDFSQLLDLIVPEQRFRVKRMFWRMSKAKQEREQMIVHMPEKSTDQRNISLLIKTALVYDENKKPSNIVGTLLVLDGPSYTEWEQLELLDQVPSAVLIANAGGKLAYLNIKTQQLLSKLKQKKPTVELSEIIGQSAWHSLTEKLRSQEQVEHFICSPEENVYWHLSASLRGNDLFVLIMDISEQEQSIQELQKVNFDLDNFVYHASHDLRAPLRTVLGMLSILKSETNKEQRKRCVDLIEGSIKRLDTLVVDLLSISRNNRTKNPLVKINFMVEVNLAVSNYYHVGNTKNLEITTKVSQPVPFVADLTRIRIVLNNIISNAIKYRRYYLQRSFIDIRIWVDHEAAHIEIEDNGEGIPEEKLSHIFDMFYRASEQSEGSGLGLYIVKDALDKLEGDIQVDSTFDQGTTFKLKIPNRYLGA